MFLYHGSNVAVRAPRLLTSARLLDFGAGFYTTSDRRQAERWAILQARRRGEGSPTISKYSIDEQSLSGLNVLSFELPDELWLDFVVSNRKGTYQDELHDLVIGPVANDRTMAVINDYMDGSIDKRTALVLLEPQKLTDQYCFCTATALNLLECQEVTVVA